MRSGKDVTQSNSFTFLFGLINKRPLYSKFSSPKVLLETVEQIRVLTYLFFSSGLFLESSAKSSSKEKPILAPDPSANAKVTIAEKGLQETTETKRASPSEEHERNGGKRQSNFGKPQLVVKLATKKVTSKNLSREATSRRGRGRPSEKEKGTKFSHKEENGDVEHAILGEPVTDTERKEKQQGRTRRGKFVWNLTLIKRRGRNSKKNLAENLGRRPRKGYTRNAESGKTHQTAARDELAIDQDTPVSTQPVAQDKKVHAVMSAPLEVDEQENTISPDGSEGTPVVNASSPHSPKLSPRALKRRKSLFGYRRKPEQESLKMKTALGNRLPRKRRRLVCYTYESVESPVNQEQTQEPPAQAANQQGFPDSVTSSRPSRVIRVPKRFMDDEGMSGLLGKKLAQMDNPEDESRSDPEEANLSQTPRFGSKQKSANKKTTCDDEENIFGKSVELKPSGLASGPRKKVGRPVYDDATPLKIYERLKMLTASLAQRKEQRMASSRSKGLGEKVECESHDVEESPGSRELRKWGSSEIKIGDLNCPGVVHKVAIHADDQVISQSALSSVERLETKADGKEYDNLLSVLSVFLDFMTLIFPSREAQPGGCY